MTTTTSSQTAARARSGGWKSGLPSKTATRLSAPKRREAPPARRTPDRARRVTTLGALVLNQLSVDLAREHLDLCCKARDLFGDVGVLSEQFQLGLGDLLAVPRVGFCVCLLTVSLPGLREEDERRRVGGLGAEQEVQENEGIRVGPQGPHCVQGDPAEDQDRLHQQIARGPEEARERLGAPPEPVVAERRVQMQVRAVEAEVICHLGHAHPSSKSTRSLEFDR